jgi:DNA-binding beta-propeller fold protein YncE
MSHSKFARGPLCLLLLLVAGPAAAWHLAREVGIPGDGGWDYLTFDAAANRVFVSHGIRVEVIDARKLTIIGAIDGTPGVHGIALAQDLGRGFVSAGASGSVVVFDLKTLTRLTEIRTTGENPDAILYEPSTRRVFTFNGRGRNVTVIDATSNQVLGTIDVDAKPEFAVTDGAGHIFVNLEDRNSLAEIDAAGMKILRTWPLEGCEEPSGLAFDLAHHRLFSVCGNRVMVVSDSGDGHQVARLPIGEGADGAGFDPQKALAFASCGDGTLTVVHELKPGKFAVKENVATRKGARTMTLDPATHRVFLTTAQRGAAPAPTAENPRPRAPVIPGTFTLLMVQP